MTCAEIVRSYTREKNKLRYEKFREIARDGAEILRRRDGTATVIIPEHPSVEVTEGGAFVEARVWVPEHLLPVQLR